MIWAADKSAENRCMLTSLVARPCQRGLLASYVLVLLVLEQKFLAQTILG